MGLIGPISSGIATGGAGVAVAQQDSSVPVYGFLQAIRVEYQNTPPASTDVTISTKGGQAPSLSLLTLIDVNTDGWYFPRINVHNASGVAQAAVWDRLYLSDIVRVAIGQTDDGCSANVWIVTSEA